MSVLPLLGLAIPSRLLPEFRDLLLDDYRDLELQDFFDSKLLNGDWRDVADHAKVQLEGYQGRLGIHGPFWGLDIANPDPDMAALVRHKHLQGLDVCAHLGATQMVVHSPYTTWDYNNLDDDKGLTRHDRLRENCHHIMDAVVRRAEELGVTLVIENIEDKDPDSRCLLADSFNSASVAVSVDTGHAHYAHGSTGAPPVDYFIRRAGNRLRHVHLQDADGYADRHWPIGQGTILWNSVFAALAELTSEPRLILELRDKTAIRGSIRWLQEAGLAR
ncbi:sugar phosphate isomerase/epimerase family protein [Szabonella alba]|uniref:Sugar phosphate isomerase/epimerase n=1 Tax=Szabonella alba TaxID=2804194 RepID=A0A8K0XZ53_9RHOB|nr:sugar phosphate isomerase/epimerase family protein [Szabonella alba]MBL4916755.1 sugar phosphate isomerase/epimerase [Szabonella alba]